jgi:hypothetical protein
MTTVLSSSSSWRTSGRWFIEVQGVGMVGAEQGFEDHQGALKVGAVGGRLINGL